MRFSTLTFFLAGLYSAHAQAPPAHCYDESNGTPPPGISDLYVDECGRKDLWFTGSNYDGWTVYYDRTDFDLGHNVGTSCSDLAGDVRNVLSQCPHGGALLHQNRVNTFGVVIVEKIEGPNAPPIPYKHYHGP